MEEGNTGLLTARTPLQRRGQDRFDAVLAEARVLLEREGLANFSIPVIAERLGYTRASIYNFFPTPQAVLNELVRRELNDLEQHLAGEIAAHPRRTWREHVAATVHAAARFYARHPVAALLILGGQLNDESYRAVALTVSQIGKTAQRLFAQFTGAQVPRLAVDVLTLAVELGTTCFRHSVLMHGHITPAYTEEAVKVMERYLEPYAQQYLRMFGAQDPRPAAARAAIRS